MTRTVSLWITISANPKGLIYDTSGDYITGCGPDAAASSINYLHKVKWRNEKMAKIYYQEDCNLSLLDGKTIAVI